MPFSVVIPTPRCHPGGAFSVFFFPAFLLLVFPGPFFLSSPPFSSSSPPSFFPSSPPKSGDPVTAAKCLPFAPRREGVNSHASSWIPAFAGKTGRLRMPPLCLGADRRLWSAASWIPHPVRDDGMGNWHERRGTKGAGVRSGLPGPLPGPHRWLPCCAKAGHSESLCNPLQGTLWPSMVTMRTHSLDGWRLHSGSPGRQLGLC